MSGSPLLQSAELLRLGAKAGKEHAFEALRGKTTAIYFSGACLFTYVCMYVWVGIGPAHRSNHGESPASRSTLTGGRSVD
jgi:hypothetical protein